MFDSRVMVAKEVHTRSSFKDLVVAATGVNDGALEGIHTEPTGGIRYQVRLVLEQEVGSWLSLY